jgi:uncharacterized membrane-anchored protein YjiN (DUF445 family)
MSLVVVNEYGNESPIDRILRDYRMRNYVNDMIGASVPPAVNTHLDMHLRARVDSCVSQTIIGHLHTHVPNYLNNNHQMQALLTQHLPVVRKTVEEEAKRAVDRIAAEGLLEGPVHQSFLRQLQATVDTKLHSVDDKVSNLSRDLAREVRPDIARLETDIKRLENTLDHVANVSCVTFVAGICYAGYRLLGGK